MKTFVEPAIEIEKIEMVDVIATSLDWGVGKDPV